MIDWTDAQKAQLRALWSEGHSAAEIGLRMGVSKNAIIGKAHRLTLPSRPSPILPGSEPRVRRQRYPKVTLRCLDSQASLNGTPSAAGETVDVAPSAPRIWPALPCCWPIGEPRTPSFHFCDAVALSGKPYCDEHAQIAYVRQASREATA